jgi:hypothetical protein
LTVGSGCRTTPSAGTAPPSSSRTERSTGS